MGVGLCIGLGVSLNALALLFMALSFATDHWLDYAVDRVELQTQTSFADKLMSDPLYFDRYRGLFRTCYPGTETDFLMTDTYKDKVIDGRCLPEEGYELVQSPDTVGYGSDYTARKHLM